MSENKQTNEDAKRLEESQKAMEEEAKRRADEQQRIWQLGAQNAWLNR